MFVICAIVLALLVVFNRRQLRDRSYRNGVVLVVLVAVVIASGILFAFFKIVPVHLLR